jgi:hypothetical protein
VFSLVACSPLFLRGSDEEGRKRLSYLGLQFGLQVHPLSLTPGRFPLVNAHIFRAIRIPCSACSLLPFSQIRDRAPTNAGGIQAGCLVQDAVDLPFPTLTYAK